MLNCLFKET